MPSATQPEFYGVTRVVGPDGGPVRVSGGPPIPSWNRRTFSYNASGDVTTIVYELAGAVVATESFTYIGGRIATQEIVTN